MQPDSHKLLVGRIAFQIFKANNGDSPDQTSSEGTHLLDGFEIEEVLGFALALHADNSMSQRSAIHLHPSDFNGYNVPAEYLDDTPTVDLRNKESDKITIIPIFNDAFKASFNSTDKTDVGTVIDPRNVDDHWIPIIHEHLKLNLTESSLKELKALAKGLLSTQDSSISQCVHFLVETAKDILSTGSVKSAAGQHISILGLPRFKDCFASVRADRITQARSWADALKKHQQNRGYLKKQNTKFQAITHEELQNAKKRLQDDQIPIEQEILDAFEDYIAAPYGETPASTRLLTVYDWSVTRQFFENRKSQISSSLATRTLNTLAGAGVDLPAEDKETLDLISKSKKKSTEVIELAKGFLEKHGEAINDDAKLYADWQKVVHGERITGTNLLSMIIESFRLCNLTPNTSGYRIILEGVRQGGKSRQRKSLERFNPAACKTFTQSYGKISEFTNGRVSFRNALVADYFAPDVQDYLDKAKKKPKKSNAKSANSFDFNLIIETASGNIESVEKRPMTWIFKTNSVIGEQQADFARLKSLIGEGPKTALIRSKSFYERIGPKGTAPSLALSDVVGFTDEYGAGEKGSFVPSKDRAKENNLLKDWKNAISEAEAEGIDPKKLEGPDQAFDAFNQQYKEVILALADNLLTQTGVAEMSASYRTLLESVGNFRPEKYRNRLLRIVLAIGNAEIPKSGRRPAASVICPWHPLRIEAMAARASQFRKTLKVLLSGNRPTFSDENGSLFFKECIARFEHAPYPEISTFCEVSQLRLRRVTESIEGYSLHLPVEPENESFEILADAPQKSAAIIFNQIQEYLRLQPHERDNLSVALYNCSTPVLANELVATIEKFNRDNPEEEITCQIHLIHQEPVVLREVYQKLVTSGIGAHDGGPTEATGDLLSRIRVNVAAANSLDFTKRSEPVDIVYCKDVITNIVNRKDGIAWQKQKRNFRQPEDLYPHQWTYRLPIEFGAKRTHTLLSCPAMTETGWVHLNAIASLIAGNNEDAWEAGGCLVPVTVLNFENAEIAKLFEDTHKIGTWVINEDDLLDRKLLEDKEVKVIRYIQSQTHGSSLIVSSKSKETLLRNTLRSRLQSILPGNPDNDRLSALATRFIDHANTISGGLFLRSARRAKYTGELIGVVLSRFIVQQETHSQPTAWCFLDDYAQWLGKRDESKIADLLAISWDQSGDQPTLDVIVTEAKFIAAPVDEHAKNSASQLRQTLAQLEEALVGDISPIDQEIWLARLSNLFLNRVVFTGGAASANPTEWATLIRDRKCKVRIRGYSHIFVHTQDGGIIPESQKVKKTEHGIQEVFDPGKVKDLVLLFENLQNETHEEIQNKLKQIRPTEILNVVAGTPVEITFTETQEDDDEMPPPTGDGDNNGDNPVDSPDQPATTGSAETTTQPAPPSPTNQETQPAQAPTALTPSTPEKENNPWDGHLSEYLASRSTQFSSSNEEGIEWLKQLDVKLQKAFITRQMPYVHAVGFKPILTPNAGIIRLQGKDNLTVPIVTSKASTILTSDGINIISIDPEPGQIRLTIQRPNRETLHTEPVLHAFLTNRPEDAEKERILVGVREEDGEPLLLDPFDQPHSLVAGSTGSGKSVLMQNLILSIAASRHPNESIIFLIDPKSGMDYMPLQPLPHIMNGSGGVIDSQEAALECFSAAVDEMENRYKLITEASKKLKIGIPNILAYRKITGESMPTWWMIHDEFADWMQTDSYKKEVPKLVNRLGVKARAAGIFLVFAAQRPDDNVFPMQLRSQLMNRLVLKVDGPGTSAIALGDEKMHHAAHLLGKGHMLAKIGGVPAPVYAQVPFIDPSTELPALVNAIINHYDRTTSIPNE
ncbi:MAG: DNA translocase FtsK [Verrucomicrobia bacterium]|nr:MAG: DNA translocase FtsK [Verrucomicrobiota bacterium]